MSGEFGSYDGGYMWWHVLRAAEDCLHEPSSHPVTPMVGRLLDALAPLAKGVCWYEACDSGFDRPVVDLLDQIDAIEAAVKELRGYAAPFQRVARDAVLKAATMANNPPSDDA